MPPEFTRSVDISIQQLHTFRKVMECGGYAAAAKVSHLSTPAVWQHIQALENAYGVQLFERVGRQVKPTAAATRLHEVVDEILVRLESAFDVVQESHSEEAIRIVTGVRMMIEDLAGPFARFRQRHTNRLEIRHGNNARAEELLLAGETDIAMSLESGFQQESPLIHYEPAYLVEFFAVTNPDHPFAKAKPASLRSLVKHELIVTVPGTHGRNALDHALHKEGLHANIAVETDNSAFTFACVRVGMGVGIVAGRLNGELCKGLVIRSLRQQLGQRQIVFRWRKGQLLTEPVLDLIDEVKQLDNSL
mgnify:CR=1 FL=1